MRKYTVIIIVYLFCFCGETYGQTFSGFSGDTYSGFSQINYNPALGTGTRNYLEINFLTGGFFVRNNYLYMHKGDYSLLGFTGKNPVFPKYGTDSLPFDKYDNASLKDGFAFSRIIGPGFLASVSGYTIGFSVNAVENFSFTDIPANVADLFYTTLKDSSKYGEYYKNSYLKTSGMAGLEYQFHVSKIIKISGENQFSAGLNLSYISANSGLYANVSQFDYTLVNDSAIYVSNFKGDLGFSLPINYNDTTFSMQGPFFKGSGFAAGIGIVFTKLYEEPMKHRYNRSCEEPYHDYLYKLGISLMDLGSIGFKKNARKHQYDDVNNYNFNIYDTIEANTVDGLFNEISQNLLNDSLASLTGTSFRLMQPLSLNLLADFHISEPVYLNCRASLNLKVAPNQLQKPSILAITPRYETNHFAISLPVSLYQFQKVNLGLAMRFHFFSIGTDRLGAWLSTGDFTGLDLYFSARYFLNKGKCSAPPRSKPCRDFEF